ncbi:MAG: hypothetical protein FWD65_06260 [Coriobacteriia bacterium]|nr:hypothetical protein [Coriobacteriia bacterium]
MAVILFCLPAVTRATTYDCAAGKHDFRAVKTVKPTKTTDGFVLYRCALCGLEYKQILYATGHKWGPWTTTKKPTCTQPGTEERTCSVGVGHRETKTIPATGHHFTETIVQPTCTQPGKKTYTCTICGYTHTEAFGAALGHDYAHKVTTKPTCTQPGTETSVCTRCGDSYTESIALLGHDYGPWITETPARPGVAGRRYRQCPRCGDRIYETIPALPLPEPEPAAMRTHATPPSRLPEITLAVTNVAALVTFIALLFGEFMVLAWKRRKKKEILEQKRYEESGADGYEYL